MMQRTRIYYTETDKALMRDRWQKGESLQSIAQLLGRSPSTISREINRNGERQGYRANEAEQAAWDRAHRPKTGQAHKLPRELYKSLTWDRGSEMADHQRFTLATDVDVHFCDPLFSDLESPFPPHQPTAHDQ